MFNNTTKCQECGKVSRVSIVTKRQSFTVADELVSETAYVKSFCLKCWPIWKEWIEQLPNHEYKHMAGPRKNKWIGTETYYLNTITHFD